jgi:hypothetical protein
LAFDPDLRVGAVSHVLCCQGDGCDDSIACLLTRASSLSCWELMIPKCSSKASFQSASTNNNLEWPKDALWFLRVDVHMSLPRISSLTVFSTFNCVGLGVASSMDSFIARICNMNVGSALASKAAGSTVCCEAMCCYAASLAILLIWGCWGEGGKGAAAMAT